jgi:UDP-glucuronate 4-epimerase
VILVTGAAGFIGYHVARRLLEREEIVLGVDNMNTYYDVKLKYDRLAQLSLFKNFTFLKVDVADREALYSVFSSSSIRSVVHLAAQAGVRYSLVNPYAYIEANITGFLNVLENCRHAEVQHLVFASSSSVYGGNTRLPFSVHDNVDHPVSLYAVTKKSNELMAHAYAHLYDIRCTGLRFFTVYGPWGRPDMALFTFTKAILEGRAIDVFNSGNMQRDFTYIDDIAEGVLRVLDKPASPSPNWSSDTPDPGTSSVPYLIYNIGNHRPVELPYLIEVLEKALGKAAQKNLLPMQPGDVPATYADVDDLIRDVHFKPDTPIEVGIQRFVNWYQDYYRRN